MIPQIRPADFAAWLLASGDSQPPVVLDVREAWEVQTASVTPSGCTVEHIPMREIPARLADLQAAHRPDQPLVCLCHHGIRSQQVASFLAHHGFTHVVNLQGGIEAWSHQVDPSVPQY